MSKISVNGVYLNVEIEGIERGPWITFSHSHATNLSLWDEQVAHFRRDFRILRYDTRGHGKSDAVKGACTVETLVSDVIGLWDVLGIMKSHFIGLSLGGTTGIGLAIHHPNRISKLAACNCHGVASPEFSAAWNPRIEVALLRGMRALVDPTLERWFSLEFRQSNAALVAEVARMIRSTSIEGYVGCARALQGIAYQEHLESIRTPTLFIAGAQDKAAQPAGIRLMQQCLPGARYVEVDPAGHLSNLENPRRFNEAVGAFLTVPID